MNEIYIYEYGMDFLYSLLKAHSLMYILGCYALFIGVCFLCYPCAQTFYFSNSARYIYISWPHIRHQYLLQSDLSLCRAKWVYGLPRADICTQMWKFLCPCTTIAFYCWKDKENSCRTMVAFISQSLGHWV